MNRLLYFLFLFCISSIIKSQSIGIGYGLSGTQNFGEPESTIHASVLININEKILGCISISNWSGIDGNMQFYDSNVSRGSFYGNVGIGLSFLYKYYNSADWEYYLGVGLNQFERIHKDLGWESSFYEPAISITPLFIKYNLNETISLFTNGTLSFSANYANPNWGSLVVGIYVNPISMFK
jgi:hypothetical protein